MDNKTKKSDSVKFELRTVADLTMDNIQNKVDLKYDKEYLKNDASASHNTVLDNNLSNRAEDLLKCPKCGSANLYKSLSDEYVECEDCDRAIKKSAVKKEKK